MTPKGKATIFANNNTLEQGSKDIHDVIRLGKLIRKGVGPEEIEGLAKTFAKYTNNTCAN